MRRGGFKGFPDRLAALLGSTGLVSLASGVLAAFGRHACKLRLASGLSVATATLTTIDWTAEDEDTAGLHDLVTNPSRITLTEGTWAFAASVYLGTGTATAIRWLQVRHLNSSSTVLRIWPLRVPPIPNAAMEASLSIGGVCRAAAGDYLDVQIYHDKGSNLSVGANTSTGFEAERIAP